MNKYYRNASLQRVQDKQKFLRSMSKEHQNLLESYKNHLDDQKACIEHNAEIIKLILKDVENMFENTQHDLVIIISF